MDVYNEKPPAATAGCDEPTNPSFRFEIIKSEAESDVSDTHFSNSCRLERSETRLPDLTGASIRRWINMIAWCHFCRCEHYHGTYGDLMGKADEGHRDAHCVDKSRPFENTGLHTEAQ